jgi:hypothetical protein
MFPEFVVTGSGVDKASGVDMMKFFEELDMLVDRIWQHAAE